MVQAVNCATFKININIYMTYIINIYYLNTDLVGSNNSVKSNQNAEKPAWS